MTRSVHSVSDLVVLLEQCAGVVDNHRRIIAVAGAPGSGKSTLAGALAQHIPNSKVVPMDGFHLDNARLEQMGLLARKGAPETFDVAGLRRLIKALESCQDVMFPTFDRTADSVVENGGCVTQSDRTVIVEGNYLLLNHPEWQALGSAWSDTVFLDVPIDVLQSRLTARWTGLGFSDKDAMDRVGLNDLPNARTVVENSQSPDFIFRE